MTALKHFGQPHLLDLFNTPHIDYDNSWVLMDGQVVQSVSGGGHWGGGMFINAYDMARFGYLSLHKGK